MPAVASSGDGMNQHSGGKYKQCCRQPSSSQEDERREAFQSNFFIFMAPLLQEKDDVHWNFCREKNGFTLSVRNYLIGPLVQKCYNFGSR